MKLKAATIKDLNMIWYLARKPYTRHTDYDVFYLDICRRVFEILHRTASGCFDADSMPEREHLMELAYIATAYFEDKMNGLGFWNAAADLIGEAIGKRIPFYKQDDTKANDRNDVHGEELHLLFFLATLNSFLDVPEMGAVAVPFSDPFIMAAAGDVMDYFETIDEIEETDFYSTWLDVRTLDYVDLKRRVMWLARYGYIFTGYLTARIRNDIDEFVAGEDRRTLRPEDVNAAAYLKLDHHSFHTPSNLMGVYPVDVLARIVIADDGQGAQIEAMKNRPMGNFRVEASGTDYRFTHTITGDVFDVDGSGLTGGLPLQPPALFSTTLASWGGRWYVSGLCIPVSEATAAETDFDNQRNHCVYRREYREQLQKTGREHHAYELRYHGTRLIEFENIAALEKSMNAFQAWYLERLKETNPSIAKDEQPVEIKLGNELPRRKPAALFLPAGDNSEITVAHARIRRAMEAESHTALRPGDGAFLAEMFAEEGLSAPYWRYMREHYGRDILAYVLMTPCAEDADFEALLRIYRPREFSVRKLPEFTLANLNWDATMNG